MNAKKAKALRRAARQAYFNVLRDTVAKAEEDGTSQYEAVMSVPPPQVFYKRAKAKLKRMKL